MLKKIATKYGRINYCEWGNQNPKVVILLHGSLQTLHTWDEFCEKASSKYRLIAFDQRGHGETFHDSVDKDYSTDAMTKDLDSIVSLLNIDSFSLIGMSMGAANALSYSSLFTNKIESLVMVDWVPSLDTFEVQKLLQTMTQKWSTFEDCVSEMCRFNPQRPEEIIRERLKYSVEQKNDNTWSWKADTSGILQYRTHQSYNSHKTQTLWESVEKVQCPILLLKGENSGFVSIENANKFTARAKNAQLKVILKAGHSVQGDNPKEFYSTVMNFLESIYQKENETTTTMKSKY